MTPTARPDDSGETAQMALASRWSTAAGWAVLGFLFAFGLYACRYGLDLFDSGLYPSMGWRYTQGDLPFRDETFSSHFDLLYWLLFALNPDATQIHIRFLGVAIEMGALACWFVLLKRFAPPVLVALAVGAGAYVSAGGLWVPGYDVLGSRLFHASIAVWLLACLAATRRRGDLLAVSGASLFLLSVMCHPAMLAGLAAPAGAAGYLVWKRPEATPWTRPTVIYAAISVAGLGVAGLLLLASGTLTHEAASFQATGDLVSPAHRIKKLGFGIVLFSPAIFVLALTLLVCSVSTRQRNAARQWKELALTAFVGALALGGALFSYSLPTPGWIDTATTYYSVLFLVSDPLIPDWVGNPLFFFGQHWISVLSLAGLTAVAARWYVDRHQIDAPWRFILWSVIGSMLLVSSLHALASYTGFRKFVFGISPIFAVSIVHLYRMAAARAPETATARTRALLALPLAAVCIVYGTIQLHDRLYRFYGEPGREYLTATSEHPLLRGIYSGPERIRLVEAATDAVKARTRPGDLFLEFGASPLFYYLTRTRPAMSKTWCIPAYNDARQQRLLDRMIADGREPDYCLTSLVHPHVLGYRDNWTWDQVRAEAGGPITRYIEENYEPVEDIGPMRLWRRKAKDSRRPETSIQ